MFMSAISEINQGKKNFFNMNNICPSSQPLVLCAVMRQSTRSGTEKIKGNRKFNITLSLIVIAVNFYLTGCYLPFLSSLFNDNAVPANIVNP